jgi:hypothetical protein
MLRARLSIAGNEIPLWAMAASLALPLILTSTLVGVAAGVRETRVRPVVVVAPGPAAPAPTPAPAAAAPVECVVPGAATPDTAPAGAPTVEHVLARAEAVREVEISGARTFAGVLSREPVAINQPSVLVELGQHLSRPHTAREALGALAALPGPIGADLLFEIWSGTSVPRRSRDVTELARQLLYSREVLSRASPALRVALDLRATEGCEGQLPLLERAATDGDRRSLVPLAKLAWTHGCGPNKRQDCFACLRKGSELKSAIRAVKQRRAPKRRIWP